MTTTAVKTPLGPLFDLFHDILVNLTEPTSYKVARIRSGANIEAGEPVWLARSASGVPSLFPRSQSPRVVVYGAEWKVGKHKRSIELVDGQLIVNNNRSTTDTLIIMLSQLKAQDGAHEALVRIALELLGPGWNSVSKPSKK